MSIVNIVSKSLPELKSFIAGMQAVEAMMHQGPAGYQSQAPYGGGWNGQSGAIRPVQMQAPIGQLYPITKVKADGPGVDFEEYRIAIPNINPMVPPGTMPDVVCELVDGHLFVRDSN